MIGAPDRCHITDRGIIVAGSSEDDHCQKMKLLHLNNNSVIALLKLLIHCACVGMTRFECQQIQIASIINNIK